MPLIKSASKKALKENIKTEMDANPGKKDRAQNLAIAYNIQRKAKAKKMADGGMASPSPSPESSPSPSVDLDFADKMGKAMGGKGAVNKAKGGMIEKSDKAHASEDTDEHYESIADAILAKKRKAKMMAEGGQVDLEEHSEEHSNLYDKLDEEIADEPIYDDTQISAQPEDSNEHGDDIESDKHDMVDRIRSKMRAKRGM